MGQPRVRVDEQRRRLLLRPPGDATWHTVPLFREVRSHLDTATHVFVAWYGDFDAEGEDLPLEPDAPTISAYDYRGTCLWTLRGRDLPYYDRDGTRARGISYVSIERRTQGSRLLVRSGTWYCELLDVDEPSLGLPERTKAPDT